MIIVTRVDWYRINIYVATYESYSFVLKVNIYTVKYNYDNNDNTDMLNTVNVFLNCVRHFKGRTVLLC